MTKDYNIADFTSLPQGCVLVIGNFDGVHRGHQELLTRAGEIARDKQADLAVLTFEPHPRRLFQPDEPPSRITPYALKEERLRASGAQHIIALEFNWEFASQSAEHFINSVLQEGIQPVHIVVGYDFRFGQLRKGTPGMIKAAGIPVTVIEEVADEGSAKYSSSAVRQAIRKGDIARANDLLGWEWEIHGEVVKGDQRGRELGYPTANMALGDIVHPAYGVYAVMAQIEGEEEWRAGATNIGIRPMFEVPTAQVETFIFDFDREIYGQVLKVRPVKHLRGEAKFETLEELTAQMARDCEQAKEVLGNNL